VIVAPSRLSGASAGEGLFSRRDFRADDVLALFTGVRLQSSREDEASEYKIRLNGAVDLDIPPAFASTLVYSATKGHKANHAFGKAANARWGRMDHPRFGLICTVVAKCGIVEGEEILVDYGLGLADAPEWYKALFVQHCRLEEAMSDATIVDYCRRRYAANGRHIQLPL